MWLSSRKIYGRSDVHTTTSTEKTHEFNVDTNHLFIDFKQAYDSIRRCKFLPAMYTLGIPARLVNICGITLAGEKSDTFETTKGFRQGDGLFVTCLTSVWKQSFKRPA